MRNRINQKKPPDTDLEEKRKTNLVFCTTIDPGTSKEGNFPTYQPTPTYLDNSITTTKF